MCVVITDLTNLMTTIPSNKKSPAVANGKFDTLEIFGTDYDNRDGTCIRNYNRMSQTL